MPEKLTPKTFGLLTNGPTTVTTDNCSKQITKNFETLPSAEEIAERVVNILRSYKKRLKNTGTLNNYKNRLYKPYNQNEHLSRWQTYAQVLFTQANIPEKYYYFLIKITENYFDEEKDIRNILIKAINSYNKKS